MEPAWFAAGAAAAGAGAAWFAAINGSRTFRQARRDSRARSRPMVAAELRKPPYSKGVQSLVVTNYGPSLARNVRVRFEPDIPDPPPELAAQSVTPFLKRRYSKPISVLTPGMALENIYCVTTPGDGTSFNNMEPTPESVTVIIEYEDGDGHSYVDQFQLDTSLLRQHTFSTASDDPQQLAKEALKTLKQIAGKLPSD